MRFKSPFSRAANKTVEQAQQPQGSSEERSFGANIMDLLPFGNFGSNITHKSSLTITAYWSALRILSETIASLDIDVFKSVGDGKQLNENHPLYLILKYKPNQFMGRFNFMQAIMLNLLTWGNAYAVILKDASGKVTQILPLESEYVSPYYNKKGDLRYYYKPAHGADQSLAAEEMLHFRAFSFTGILGISPVQAHKNTLGLNKTMDNFASSLFERGAVPSIILEAEKTITKDAQERLISTFSAAYAGLDNSHKAMLLEEGMKAKTLTMNLEDTQFLESRKYGVEEICRIFRVPPHMMASLDKATYSNIGEQSLSFIKDTMTPYIENIQLELNLKLIGLENMSKDQIVFNLSKYLRSDPKARAEYYKSAIAGSWMSPNEVRDLEDMNPIDGMSMPLIPLNMKMHGEAGDSTGERSMNAMWQMSKERIEGFEARCASKDKSTDSETYKKFVERELQHFVKCCRYVSNSFADNAQQQLSNFVEQRFMKFSSMHDNKDIESLPDFMQVMRTHNIEEAV